MNDERRRLGEYRLIEKLGAGGMGTVWRARTEDRVVALKVLHPHLVDVPGYFQRFQREAELGREVDHPNIVRVLDADLVANEGEIRCLLVMELVEGRTLRQLLRELGQVPEGLLREIAEQVVDGLAAIHDRGIVHRDLKPENIVVTGDNRVRIMDLGVARLPDSSREITKEGSFAGSTLYAAPEQLRGEEVGPPADLYSLGVCLYELASGRNPFSGPDVGAVIHRHLNVDPPGLRTRAPAISEFIEALVAWLLSKDPDDRPDDAAALLPVLREAEASDWWRAREGGRQGTGPPLPQVSVRRDTRLHGRTADMDCLEAAWEDAREGRGRVVLVTGEPGIGKTRLTDEFLRRRTVERAHLLYGSYAPGDARGALSGSLAEQIGNADPTDFLSRYLSGSPDLVAAFAERIRPGSSTGDVPPASRDAVRSAYQEVLTGMAAEMPVLWVIEDVHLASAESRELLLSLGRTVADHRGLIVLTSRPDLHPGVPEELATFPHAERRQLSRLSPREVVLMLRDILSPDWLADRLGTRIAYKSDGVPFVILEILDMLTESGRIDELVERGRDAPPENDVIQIPTAVRDLISSRLARIDDEDRRLLEMSAVQGHSFDPDLVARMADLPRVRILERLAAIERRTLLVRSEGSGMRFDHHLVTEVITEETMNALRREYHALLAERFAAREGLEEAGAESAAGWKAVLLARHQLAGVSPERAENWALPGLKHLQREFRHEQALDLARQIWNRREALSANVVLSAGYTETEILVDQNRSEEAQRRYRELTELADEAGGPLHRAWIRTVLARRHMERSDHQEARELLAEAREIARDPDAVRARPFVLLVTGNLLYNLGETDQAQEEWRACVDAARQVEDHHRHMIALGNLAHGAWFAGDVEAGRKGYERGIRAANEAGDFAVEASFRCQLSDLFLLTGQIDAAKEQAEVATDIAHRILHLRHELGGRATYGCCLLVEGRLDEAEPILREAARRIERIGDWRRLTSCEGNLGLVLVHRGEYAEAWEHFERQRRLSEDSGFILGRAMAAGGRSLVEAATGDLGAAFADARTKVALSREADFLIGVGAGLTLEARLLALLGADREAEAALVEAIDCLRRVQSPQEIACALREQAALAGRRGDVPEALRLLDDAIGLLRGIPARALLAEALCDRGDLIAGDAPERSREALQEARELAAGIGLTKELFRARVPLAALGIGTGDRVLEGLREAGPRIPCAIRMILLHELAAILGKPSLAAEAAGILEGLVASAPAEYRDSMIAEVPLHREIAEAG